MCPSWRGYPLTHASATLASFLLSLDSEAASMLCGPELSAMQKRCKITRCVYERDADQALRPLALSPSYASAPKSCPTRRAGGLMKAPRGGQRCGERA